MTDTNSTTSICSYEGCDSPTRKRGYCNSHYLRLRRTGKLNLLKRKSDKERFLDKIQKCQVTGAWFWSGAIHKNTGYGYFGMQSQYGRAILAHRAAWELFVGPIPDGKMVCHKYEHLGRHNVNPDHLFLGSNADNMRDASRKGRTSSGSKHPLSLLTGEQAVEIYESCEARKNIAARFGVDVDVVHNIKRGKTYRRDTGAELKTGMSAANTSGYIGVRQKKGARKWEAMIYRSSGNGRKQIFLGAFDDPVQAAIRYDLAAIELRGDKAKLNFPGSYSSSS